MPLLSGINLAARSWDWYLVLFFVIFLTVYVLSLGRGRTLAAVIAVYSGLAAVSNVPYLENLLGGSGSLAFRVGVFLAVFAALFFFLSRSAMLGSHYSGGLLMTALFGALCVGLITSVGMTLLPASVQGNFSGPMRTVFSSDIARLSWLAAPIAAMMFFGGFRKN